MSAPNYAKIATRRGGLASVNAANTAAATGAWIDVTDAEGDILINANVGIVTAGNITPGLEDADDISGTNNAAVTPREGAFTTVNTGNDPLAQKRTVPASSIRGFVRFVGTVTTGPAQVAADIYALPKNG